MNPIIKAAFEKAFREELEPHFGGCHLRVGTDGEYIDHEVYGAFHAFASCWNQRPAMGMWLDVTVGAIQRDDDGSAPRASFTPVLYGLPPGDYALHAVQRVEGLEDIAAAEQAKVEQAVAPGWNAPDVDPVINAGTDKDFIVAVRRQHNGKVYTFPATYCNDLPLMSDDPKDADGAGWTQREAGEDDEDGDVYITGWFDIRSDAEYENRYHPALQKGDELVAWREIEAYPA